MRWVQNSKGILIPKKEAGFITVGPAFFANQGGGSTLWTPANLATLPAIWANDTSPLTTDTNGNCSQWNDISGNARHFIQISLGSDPSITASGQNGLREITFNAVTGQSLIGNLAARSLTNNITQLAQFVVANPAPSSFSRVLTFSIGGGAYNATNRAGFNIQTSGLTAVQRRQDADSGVNAVIAYSTQACHIFSSEHNWTAQTVGARMDGGTLTSSNTSQGSGATSATTSWVVDLGGELNVSQYLTGSIGEIIVLGYVPSTSDRQMIEGYLAWKWGLEANLPSGHPYKSAPP